MRLALLLILALLIAPVASAAQWALGGMDAVSYRKAGRATPGRADVVTHWAGQDWHFATEANRAQFEANPRAYAPAFNGYCPVSLAEGRPQPGDPRQFVIVGERLYLLRSAQARKTLLASTRDILMRAKAAFVAMAP